jgi:hypothetical protein
MRSRRGFARALIIGGVLVVALLGVHAYNATRFNVGELRASAETLLARARQISDRARSEYEDTNMTTWRKLTEAENVDFQLDPRTLEHLRGLGYVN